VVICLERGGNGLHMVQLMPLSPHHLLLKIQIGLTFLVPAYPGCPGKEAIKRVSVCLLLVVIGTLWYELCKNSQTDQVAIWDVDLGSMYWMGVHIGVTWWIWLTHPCVVEMQPLVKLLWPFVLYRFYVIFCNFTGFSIVVDIRTATCYYF